MCVCVSASSDIEVHLFTLCDFMESQAPDRNSHLDGYFDDAIEIPQDAQERQTAVSGCLCR